MLRRILNLLPDTADGGSSGATTQAEKPVASTQVQQSGFDAYEKSTLTPTAPPANLKGTTFEDEDTVVDPALNEGKKNSSPDDIAKVRNEDSLKLKERLTTKKFTQEPEVNEAQVELDKKAAEKLAKKEGLNLPTPAELEAKKKAEAEKTEEEPEVETEEAVTEEKFPEGKRDYSAYPPDVAAALKNTPNKAFAKLNEYIPKILSDKVTAEKKAAEAVKRAEVAEKYLGGEVPNEWYKHEAAYKLTPQYQQSQQQLGAISYEKQFYTEQLVKCMEGEEFHTITGYDKATGQPIYSAPYKANPQSQVQLQNIIANADQMSVQHQQKIGALKQQFTQHYEAKEKYAQDVIQKNFAWMSDEKHAWQSHVQDFLKAVPQEDHADTRVKIMSGMYAVIQEQAKELEKFRVAQKTGNKVAAITAAVEPNPGSTQQGARSGTGLKGNGTTKLKLNGVMREVPATFSDDDFKF